MDGEKINYYEFINKIKFGNINSYFNIKDKRVSRLDFNFLFTVRTKEWRKLESLEL